MKTRFKELLDAKELNAKQMAEILEINPSNISHILSGRSLPGAGMLKSIGEAFPDISLDWLITGNGNMYKAIPDISSVKSEKNLFTYNPDIRREKLLSEQGKNMEVIPDATDKRNESLRDTEGRNAEKSGLYPDIIKKIIVLYEDGSFDIYHPH